MTGHQHANCLQCKARGIANAQPHFFAAKEQRIDQAYLNALQTVFGVEWEAGHRSVKAWAERIKAAKQHKEQHA